MTLTDDVAKRYGVHVRQVDMKKYDEDVQKIIRSLESEPYQQLGFYICDKGRSRSSCA